MQLLSVILHFNSASLLSSHLRNFYFSTYPSVYLSFCLPLLLSSYPPVSISFCFPILLSAYLSVCLSFCLPSPLPVYPSFFVPLHQSIAFVYDPISLYVSLPIYLSVILCLPIFPSIRNQSINIPLFLNAMEFHLPLNFLHTFLECRFICGVLEKWRVLCLWKRR